VSEHARPVVVVIGGPNGAGKSTIAARVLQGALAVSEFVNADVIARGLSAFDPDSVAVQAGRIMLERLRALAAQRASFAFETTLSGRSFIPWLRELTATGHDFHLVYVWLPSAELALERVAERVRRGGHDIAEDVVRRRYAAGVRNFFELYRPLATSWRVYDNSGRAPLLVATGEREDVLTVEQADTWARIRAGAPLRWREVPMKEPRSRITRIMLETREVDEAVRLAVRDALLEHKREGRPVVIWRDGKVVWISAEEALGELDGETPPT
jgi:predicted ABC-type ATPase